MNERDKELRITKRKIIESVCKFKWYLIFVFIVSLIFYYVINNYTYNFFKSSVQDFISSPDAIIYLYIGTMVDLFLIFFYITLVAYRKFILHVKSKNAWLEVTILLIILSGMLGFFFLNSFTSPELNSLLRDARNGTVIGELNCTDNTGHFLANGIVICKIKQPDLHNFTVNISFTLKNGTTFVESQNNNISFISPYDMKRIQFDIVGLDKTNNSISLSTARDFEFYTESQYSESKGKYITYLIGIITIIFITIPSVMANFKKLCEEKCIQF